MTVTGWLELFRARLGYKLYYVLPPPTSEENVATPVKDRVTSDCMTVEDVVICSVQCVVLYLDYLAAVRPVLK